MVKFIRVNIIITFVVIVFCNQIFGQEESDSMNKRVPQNTIKIFEISGETFYLFDIYSENKMFNKNDFQIWYKYIGGKYPNRFFESWMWLHFTCQNNIYKLESKLLSQTFYETKGTEDEITDEVIEEVGHNEPSGESYFVDYSNKNSLEVKVLDYYLNNNDKK